MNNKEVQFIAKQTMDYIKNVITPGMKLMQVRKMCEKKMLELGADSFWYWDIGAFIFSGDDTTKSVSGKEYETSDKYIEENDIVIIDLSPQCNHIWGDYARTIIIEEGKVVECLDSIQNEEWREGIALEQMLHQEFIDFVNDTTTFEALYYHMNSKISEARFVNLDFLGNLGHSIEKKSENRIYIEKGNQTKLIDKEYFTFEPHIARPDSMFGYKWENIYYFDHGKLKVL